MMKSVLIAIRPQRVEKIASGEKTIEVRKSAPQEVPFKAYIYETQGRTETPWIDEDGHFIYKGRGQVIGDFICDKVDKIMTLQHTYYNFLGVPLATTTEYCIWNDDLPQMCLTKKEIEEYGKGKTLYGWHISDLKIYDKPKELSEFYTKKKCNSCKKSGYESTACMYDEDCKVPMSITRAPQSWQYVEDLGEEE